MLQGLLPHTHFIANTKPLRHCRIRFHCFQKPLPSVCPNIPCKASPLSYRIRCSPWTIFCRAISFQDMPQLTTRWEHATLPSPPPPNFYGALFSSTLAETLAFTFTINQESGPKPEKQFHMAIERGNNHNKLLLADSFAYTLLPLYLVVWFRFSQFHACSFDL